MALASRVLPVPGGPHNRAPCVIGRKWSMMEGVNGQVESVLWQAVCSDSI